MASNVVEWAVSQSDDILGRAWTAALSILPRILTPDVIDYDVDTLGPLVPEWGAADSRKATKIKENEGATQVAPVA